MEQLGDDSNLKGFFAPYTAIADETATRMRIQENTLQIFIEDELLGRSLVWLLGYDARGPLSQQIAAGGDQSVRAQTEGSHWITAHCISQFLDARTILWEHHPHIVGEIDRRLLSDVSSVNPLLWLLDSPTVTPQGEAYWYGGEYNSATVVIALLRVLQEANLQIPAAVRKRIRVLLPQVFAWLYRHLDRPMDSERSDYVLGTVLESFVVTLAQFPDLLDSANPSKDAYNRKRIYSALEAWFTFHEARHTSQADDGFRKYDIGHDQAFFLCRLVDECHKKTFRENDALLSYAKRAVPLLLDYARYLETQVEIGRWGNYQHRISRLGAYVSAMMAVAQSDELSYGQLAINSAVVLRILSDLMKETFTNGSMYHSALPTSYLVRTLLYIWQWPGAQKKIVALYQGVLERSVGAMSVERQESFSLRSRLQTAQNALAEDERIMSDFLAKARRDRYLLLFALVASLVMLAVVFVAQYVSPQNRLSLFGTALGLLTIVLVLLEVFIFRREERDLLRRRGEYSGKKL